MHLLLTRLRNALASKEPRPSKKIMGELLEKRWHKDHEALLVELNRLVQRYRLEEAIALLDKKFMYIMGKEDERTGD